MYSTLLAGTTEPRSRIARRFLQIYPWLAQEWGIGDDTTTPPATDPGTATTTNATAPVREERNFYRRHRWQPRQQRAPQLRQQRRWQPRPQQGRGTTDPAGTTDQSGQFAPPGYYEAQPQIEAPAAAVPVAAPSSGLPSWVIPGAIAAGAALLVGMMTSKK